MARGEGLEVVGDGGVECVCDCGGVLLYGWGVVWGCSWVGEGLWRRWRGKWKGLGLWR